MLPALPAPATTPKTSQVGAWVGRRCAAAGELV